MKIRLLSLLLVMAMVIGMMPVTAFATEGAVSVFSDMPDDWSTKALENAVKNGLLAGYGGRIMPEGILTRAQMATIVNKAFGSTEKAALSSYTDVAPNAWYYDAMAKAVQMKTFVGDSGRLNPDKGITREEAFVVLAKALKLSGATASALDKFSDKDSVSTWAADATASFVSAGYIAGSNGRLNPKQSITRAEFAQLMDNILKNYVKAAGTYSSDLNGNVMINAPGVTLKGMTITGDLIIGDGVGDGEVTLDSVTVTGRTVIRGGGINSVKIVGNSKLQNIIIARIAGEVRVYAEDGTQIGEVTIDSSDDVIIEGNVGSMIVLASDIKLTAKNAEIGSIILKGQNTGIEVLKESKLEKVIVNGGGSSIDGEGTVGTVEANANDVDVQTTGTNVIAGAGATGVTAGTVQVTPGKSEIVGGRPVVTTTTSDGGSTNVAVSSILVTGENDVTTIFTGEKLQMHAAITPANATDKTITWSVATLDKGTATIDGAGLLTATGVGSVTVTARNAASGVTGTRVIAIIPPRQVPSVSVGAQDGKIFAQADDQSATYAVTTSFISDGQAVTVTGCTSDGTAIGTGPEMVGPGLTVAGSAVSNNKSTITVTASHASAGTYYFKVTINGVTSELIPLVVTVSNQAATMPTAALSTTPAALDNTVSLTGLAESTTYEWVIGAPVDWTTPNEFAVGAGVTTKDLTNAGFVNGATLNLRVKATAEINASAAQVLAVAASNIGVTVSDAQKVAAAKSAVAGGSGIITATYSPDQSAETAAVQAYVNGLITNGVTAVVENVAPGSYLITYTMNAATDTDYLFLTVLLKLEAISGITGTAQAGSKLTAGALTPVFAAVSYQWMICDTPDGIYTNIPAATARTYTPVAGDAGKFIKVAATGVGNFTGTVTSAATAAIAAADAPTLTVPPRTNDDGTAIILEFNKAMADPAGKHGQFSFSIDGIGVREFSAAVLMNPYTISLTVSGPAITYGATGSVSYTPGNAAAADTGVLAAFTEPLENVVSLPDLSTPANLSLSGNVISWDPVANCDQYTVNVYNADTNIWQCSADVITNSFDWAFYSMMFQTVSNLPYGKYYTKVMANGNANYNSSSLSGQSAFVYLRDTLKVTAENNAINAGETLAASNLTGTAKNTAGETVAGVIAWDNPSATITASGSYTWTFTPADTDAYQIKTGSSNVIARSAAAGDVTVAGTKGSAITPVDVIITLTNNTFSTGIDIDTNLANWITNLPAGLTAKAKSPVAAGAATATITIAGTPTAVLSAPMAITIPAANLSSNTASPVTANANAKFAITIPLSTDTTLVPISFQFLSGLSNSPTLGRSITIKAGAKVGDLKASIRATDYSAQVYTVTTSSGVVKADSEVLVAGDKLVVTAEAGAPAVTYAIQ